MEKILENLDINSWVQNFNRSPLQENNPHESDAELIQIGEDNSHLLAITIDSVAEEITKGLYKDPFTMGWVTVMSNFSDLAAVGAKPLGIVVSVSIESTRSKAFCQNIAQGMSAACRKLGVFILGGDTNTTRTISLTGCAIGLVPQNKKVTRIGCKAGDFLFLSGCAGCGNAIALVHLAKLPEEYFPESSYRPIARIKEGQLIRNYATCCMDTSDGVIHTLDQLMRLNKKQFILNNNWDEILNPSASEICKSLNIPSWLLLAGVHGEFELCFTIHPKDISEFIQAAKKIDWDPVLIGEIKEGDGVKINNKDGLVAIDTAFIRNLSINASQNPQDYIKGLIDYASKLGI
ncbi:MAG: thiamine-monophosphate kinase [Candidatus Cloacimonetes bacterium]|nr:thiamine-monophosphate kinase [Candidatus Cloacimonadota bacterium]